MSYDGCGHLNSIWLQLLATSPISIHVVRDPKLWSNTVRQIITKERISDKYHIATNFVFTWTAHPNRYCSIAVFNERQTSYLAPKVEGTQVSHWKAPKNVVTMSEWATHNIIQKAQLDQHDMQKAYFFSNPWLLCKQGPPFCPYWTELNSCFLTRTG